MCSAQHGTDIYYEANNLKRQLFVITVLTGHGHTGRAFSHLWIPYEKLSPVLTLT